MIMVGPFLELPDPTGLLNVQQRLQIFTCVANEPCSITLLQGRHLDNSDLIMIRRDLRDWLEDPTMNQGYVSSKIYGSFQVK